MAAEEKMLDSQSPLPHFQHSAFLIAVLMTCLLSGKLAWSGNLSTSSDGDSARFISATHVQPPSKETTTSLVQPSKENGGNQAPIQKEAELRRVKAPLAEEDHLMREAVQTLDRESAVRWLSGFISSKPWNCPVREQNNWIEAILYAVERNQLPTCKEILGLVATLISIESGFHADPLVADPSRPGSMEGLLKRAELKLFEEYGPLMSIPPMPEYYAAYKEKYWPQLLTCQTESEVEGVARHLADELKKDAEKFPSVIRSVVDQKISRLANVVRSKGSMQLKLLRAKPAMRNRGEKFTDEELTQYMYTLNGGVDVGVAALKPMFIQYAVRYTQEGVLSWLFFVGMDYHYGPFSSRNMMEQVRIRDLSGEKIAIDGSFLNHDDEGSPDNEDSDTLLAATKALPYISKQAIFMAFLLEREPHYIYTDVHRAIAQAHRERFGETPFAVIGEIGVGESAEIKFGITFTTRLYLNKLDRYLNSIPWDN